ncbi:hypothetical protein [Leptodesmis sp.]
MVAVDRGAKKDPEVIPIDKGTIRILKNGQEVTIPVAGDAGC